MGSKSKTLVNGKRAGTTRNQQRKIDYAQQAAQWAKGRAKEGGSATPSRTKLSTRTNHSPGVGKNGAQHGLQAQQKKQRRMEAEARQVIYLKMTPQERLAELDRVLGKGLGAARERARILSKMKPVAAPVVPPAAVIEATTKTKQKVKPTK
jgi:hypothetical protein